MQRLKSLSPAIVASFILILAIGIATGAIVTNYNMGSRGQIKKYGIQVYWDVDKLNIANFIDWGTLEPGDSVIRTLYIENTGNFAITLSKTEQDFLPLNAETFLTLNWDYTTGTQLAKGELLPVDFVLNVDAAITGIDVFDFYITIYGDSL